MPFPRLMPVFILVGLGLCYAAYFLTYPNTDIMITRHAWNAEQGFYLKDTWWAMAIYKTIIPWITRLTIIGGVLLIAANYLRKGRKHWLTVREATYILLVLALGPGLVVNVIFKDHWGRARPIKVQEFGGTAIYSPPLIMSDQCDKNCSFVAGHPSVAFFLAAFSMLFAKGWVRTSIYSAAVCFGLFVGYVRIVQGGHFFSDVLFSGIFTLLVVHITYIVMFGLKETPTRAESTRRPD